MQFHKEKVLKYGILYLMDLGERNVPKRYLRQAKKKRKYIQLALELADSEETVDFAGDSAYRFINGVPADRGREFKPLYISGR